jgi:hypothetical protein
MNMAKKNGDGIILIRAKEIANMILEGSRIDFDALAQRWGVSTRQVANYVADAKKLITNDTRIEVEFEKAKAYNRLENLYSLAIETMDLRTALSVLEKQSKLFSFDNEIVADYSNATIPMYKHNLDGTITANVTNPVSGLSPLVIKFTDLTVTDEKRLGLVN